MVVVATMAIAERRKILSPILSALLEPIKLISLLYVVDTTNRYLAVGLIMVATVMGNSLAIALMNWFDKNKKAKRRTTLQPNRSMARSWARRSRYRRSYRHI